jgi:hypothetical protein
MVFTTPSSKANAFLVCGDVEVGFLRAFVYVTRMCSIGHEVWMEYRETISLILKLRESHKLSGSSVIHDSFDRLDEIGTGMLVGTEGEGIRERVNAFIQENPQKTLLWGYEQRRILTSWKGSPGTG